MSAQSLVKKLFLLEYAYGYWQAVKNLEMPYKIW